MDGQEIFRFLSEYGYWVIFPLMILEGPITTIMAGILASLGAFNVWIVLLLSISADIFGDIFLYGIGKKWGNSFVAKVGKYLGIAEKRVKKVDKFFRKHGGKAVFMAKSTTGLCFTTFIVAGIVRMDFKKFLRYSFLGGLMWSGFLVGMGYFYGYLWREIKQYIEWGGWLSVSLAIVTFFGISFYKKHKSRQFFANGKNGK